MKKLYYKLLITVLVLALVLPFIMRDRYGNYLMTLEDLKMPRLSLPGGNTVQQMTAAAGQQLDDHGLLDEAVVQVYKWQDTQGVWHYGEKAPQNGTAQLMNIHTQPPAVAGEPVPAPATADQEEPSVGFDLPLLHAADTLHEAQHLQQKLNEHYERQQSY